MTDTRLQELKRAWEASSSVEDEAAYLRERVRIGDLTQERLELAAYCGHGAAESISGFRFDPHVTQSPSGEQVRHWAEGLARFGESAVIRAGIAVVEPVAKFYRPEVVRLAISEADDLPLAMAKDWERLPLLALGCLGDSLEEPSIRSSHYFEEVTSRALRVCSWLAADYPEGSPEAVLLECLGYLLKCLKDPTWIGPATAVGSQGRPLSEMRRLIADAIVPWSLATP